MNVREAPRQVLEWIFRAAAVREARGELRPPDDRREIAARQAKLVLEVARRTAEPAESLPPGAPQSVLLGLYRDAVYWALAARRPDTAAPPADLRAIWDASRPDLAPASQPDNEESAALRKTLFDDYDARALDVTDGDVARVRDFAESAVSQVDAPRRRIQRLLVQRWLRLALVGAILLLLAIGARALMLGPNLAAGKPFRLSSTWPGWAGCVAANSCNGLVFHTETQDNPWAEIDLGAPKKVRRVEVVNRDDCCSENAIPLVVEVSGDRVTWTEVARRVQNFGSWSASFPPKTARFVRLRVPRRSVLHLMSFVVR
jgi:F5/8 type C domain-containing protein